jgi:diguanylate cyclase (GGDEF)-like protein
MRKSDIKTIPASIAFLAMAAAGLIILSPGMELYVKFFLVLLCFSFGYLYQIWINKAKDRFLLITRDERKRLVLLMEKAAEMGKVSFNPSKAQEETTLIISFLRELLDAQKFVVWAKKGKEFEVLLGHNIPKPLWRTLKGIEVFVSKVESLNFPARIDHIIQGTQTGNDGPRLTKGFRYFLEKIDCNWIFPLGHKNEFSGFILLNSPQKSMIDFENRLAMIVCDQLRQALTNRELKEEIETTESQLYSHLTGDKRENAHLTKVLKKKLFDLHSLFKATDNIYNILDKERLFFSFVSIVQKQMDPKWVVVFLPDEKSGDLVPKYSVGIELNVFHCVIVKKPSHFFSWFSKRSAPLCMYDLDKSLKSEWITTLLSGLGVQLVCRLVLPNGDFGIVFLGEKSTGMRYDSIDLANFEILTNMATTALQNIKQFKVIEGVSYTDSMTGLYNYRYFHKRLHEEIFRAKRFERKLSLAMFDIDNFKVYNDTYGHQAGDAVLRKLGEFLLKVVRSMDVVCRYGGEEFCVIMPESDNDECANFMERLRERIMDYPFKDEYLGHEHHITVSLGGAVYPRDAVDAGRLIYCADMALLRAKNEGRNRSVMFQSEKLVLKPSP